MVQTALPAVRLEIYLERAHCVLTNNVGLEQDREALVEGTVLDLLDQREQWPSYKGLFDSLDVFWSALSSFLIMNAQGEKSLFHLYGRARGVRDVVALPFRAMLHAVDWRAGTVTEPRERLDRTPRPWRVEVSYVGDRARPSAIVRRETERDVTAWLAKMMLGDPTVPATFNVMYKRACSREISPTKAIFTRAWKVCS